MGSLIGERKGGGLAKVRDSSLELFRIVLMLMIIAHHYVVNSGLSSEISQEGVGNISWRGLSLLMLGAWGKVGINCFVLITGYFMCMGRFRFQKFFSIYLEILFYNVVVGLFFILLGRESMTLSTVFFWVWPFKNMTTGFTSAFLAFFILIPFLNVLIDNLDQKMHCRLLVVSLFFFSCLPFFPRRSHVCIAQNYVSWFVLVYLVGAYIRRYPVKLLEHRGWMAFVACIAFVTGSASVWLAINGLPKSVHFSLTWSYFLADSYKITALAAAVAFFLFFRSLHLPYVKFVNILASTTFGVLLIHANSGAMRQWLWVDVCRNVICYRAGEGVFHAVVVVLCVYFICVVLDLLRQQLFAAIGRIHAVKGIIGRIGRAEK